MLLVWMRLWYLYVGDECFDIHDYDDDTDHDADDDDADDDTDDDINDDTDDGGRGTCILSRLKDQGPCPGPNEHPRRFMDVILRQSKAPIEIINSR